LEGRQLGVTALLLEAGADAAKKDRTGQTALDLAPVTWRPLLRGECAAEQLPSGLSAVVASTGLDVVGSSVATRTRAASDR